MNLEVAAAGSCVVPCIVGDSHSCQGDPSKQTGLKRYGPGFLFGTDLIGQIPLLHCSELPAIARQFC